MRGGRIGRSQIAGDFIGHARKDAAGQRRLFQRVASVLRRGTWETLRDAGLTTVPSNTFSLYDHVLDTAVLFGAVPERFAGLTGLESYFAMARGADGVPPLEIHLVGTGA